METNQKSASSLSRCWRKSKVHRNRKMITLNNTSWKWRRNCSNRTKALNHLRRFSEKSSFNGMILLSSISYPSRYCRDFRRKPSHWLPKCQLRLRHRNRANLSKILTWLIIFQARLRRRSCANLYLATAIKIHPWKRGISMNLKPFKPRSTKIQIKIFSARKTNCLKSVNKVKIKTCWPKRANTAKMEIWKGKRSKTPTSWSSIVKNLKPLLVKKKKRFWFNWLKKTIWTQIRF